MAKSINTILKLKDKFTPTVKSAGEKLDKFQLEAKKADYQTKKLAKSMKKHLNDGFKKTVKVTAAAGAAVAGFGLKTGFSEAIDLEGYRTQLETATKDTKKAANLMKYAINLANKTPFEGGELVEGAAKFEAMGMSSKKWLTYAGDMAGATNKSFDQSVEALIDAQAGELERLKEFGITKRMIVAKSEKMFKGEQVVNNQGQIVNQKKFNKALLSLMSDKFSGGMEKQSKTLKGLWSTVTGVTKSALANMVGMSNDGEIRAGSALDILKGKIKGVADTFAKWQNDGTLDAIAQKLGGYLSAAFNTVGKAISFCKNNASWLIPVIKGLAASFIAFKVLNSATTAMENFKKVGKAVKFLMSGMGLKFLLISAIIGAVVAVGVLLYKNWGKICAWAGRVKDKFLELTEPIRNFIGKIKSAVEWVGNLIDRFKKWIGLDGDKNVTVTETRRTQDAGDVSKKTTSRRKHATGTSYFSGGLTGFSEGGRAESAIFPSGTKIIPASQTAKAEKEKPTQIFNIIVQGNMIGNQAYMEETCNYMVGRIKAATGNT